MPRLRNALVMSLLFALAGSLAARPAAAGMKLDAWKGHIAFGYAKVVSDSLAPAGSISVAGGVDYPLGSAWRLGPTLAFSLLGSSQTKRGSVNAGLDYSMFDAALMLTWLPPRGPFARIAAGPGLASARADLSVAGGGAAFSDLAVGEVQPDFAAELTILPRSLKVVAVGAEFGARFVPVTQGAWTLLTARLAIHF